MHKWRGKIEEIPSKASDRPWRISHDIENDTLDIIDANRHIVLEDYLGADISDCNIKHILKCVNAYEPAIREIERLQDIITKLMVGRD